MRTPVFHKKADTYKQELQKAMRMLGRSTKLIGSIYLNGCYQQIIERKGDVFYAFSRLTLHRYCLLRLYGERHPIFPDAVFSFEDDGWVGRLGVEDDGMEVESMKVLVEPVDKIERGV
jgi:hypothetical protein